MLYAAWIRYCTNQREVYYQDGFPHLLGIEAHDLELHAHIAGAATTRSDFRR